MSDRTTDVLRAIDDALDGAVDWGTQFDGEAEWANDAMTWRPPEELKHHPTVEHFRDGYVVYDELQYFHRTRQLLPHPPPGAFQFRSTNSADGPAAGDSTPVCISPAEAMIPGPNGTAIHIRGAYGNEPVQVTEVDLDDLEDDED